LIVGADNDRLSCIGHMIHENCEKCLHVYMYCHAFEALTNNRQDIDRKPSSIVMPNSKLLLITGVTGYVGGRLVPQMIERAETEHQKASKGFG